MANYIWKEVNDCWKEHCSPHAYQKDNEKHVSINRELISTGAANTLLLIVCFCRIVFTIGNFIIQMIKVLVKLKVKFDKVLKHVIIVLVKLNVPKLDRLPNLLVLLRWLLRLATSFSSLLQVA